MTGWGGKLRKIDEPREMVGEDTVMVRRCYSINYKALENIIMLKVFLEKGWQ